MIVLNPPGIILGLKAEPIKHWSVWFKTPKGLHTSLATAIETCKANDWPDQVITLVSVAVSETLYEVAG